MAILVFASFGIAACPTPEEKATKAEFSNLSPGQRAKVWKAKMIRLALTENLNTEQLKVLQEVYDGFRDNTLTGEGDKGFILRLIDRMREHFTEEQRAEYFQNLTKEEIRGFSLIAVSETRMSLKTFDLCTCSYDANIVCQRCETGDMMGCTPKEWGCGPFFAFQCNSICKRYNGTRYNGVSGMEGLGEPY